MSAIYTKGQYYGNGSVSIVTSDPTSMKLIGTVSSESSLPSSDVEDGLAYIVNTGTLTYLAIYNSNAWTFIGKTAEIDLSNYVTLDGAQTITGTKTFGTVIVNDRLNVPTKVPSIPEIGDFWVE